MERINRTEEGIPDKLSSILWFCAGFTPFIVIIYSFLLGRWSWGLMDDLTILDSGGGIISRFLNYLRDLSDWGVFRPTFILHSAVFYTAFEHSPRWFYVFRAGEIFLTTLIWGWAAFRITQRKVSIFLAAAVTLSFHYFYDAFFYLSSQEVIGLFFTGLALHFFINSLELVLGQDFSGEKNKSSRAVLISHYLLGILMLVFAFGAKETFISCGMAVSASYFYLSWRNRRKDSFRILVNFSCILSAIIIIYAIFLLKVVKSEYTSSYSFAFGTIFTNLDRWFKKDFLNHFPWIIIAASVLFIDRNKTKGASQENSLKKEWGGVTALLLYLFFLGVLLPWNSIGYYATPLGLFFGLLIAFLISDRLGRLSMGRHLMMIVLALMLSLLVCEYALNRESVYQYDTDNLINWIKINKGFHGSSRTCFLQSNAPEPAAAIPKLLKRMWNLDVKMFCYSANPADKEEAFYLYSSRFSKIDAGQFQDWDTLFLSKNWIMYKRR